MQRIVTRTVALILALVIVATGILAVGTQQESRSTVSVGEFVPVVTTLYIDDTVGDYSTGPGGAMDLTPNSTKTVYCYGIVQDNNGYGTIDNVTAVLYDVAYGYVPFGTDDDANYRYSNSSCVLSERDGTKANFVCGFAVEWYANATQWNCTANATDSTGNTGGKESLTDQAINAHYSLSIPSVLDFGTHSVGYVSTEDVNITVESYSNVVIDIQVNGTDMAGAGCTGAVTSIGISNVTFLQTPHIAYGSMIPLTAGQQTLDLNMTKPTTDSSTTDLTHWKIKIPEGVQGVCNGTVTFTATAG